MRRMVSNPAFLAALGALAFFAIAAFITPDDAFRRVLTPVGVLIGIAVLWRLWDRAAAAFMAGGKLQFQQLLLGIVTLFAGLILLALNSAARSFAGSPDWWPEILGTFVIYVLVIGMLLYLFATRRNGTPIRLWAWMTVAVACAALLALALLPFIPLPV